MDPGFLSGGSVLENEFRGDDSQLDSGEAIAAAIACSFPAIGVLLEGSLIQGVFVFRFEILE